MEFIKYYLDINYNSTYITIYHNVWSSYHNSPEGQIANEIQLMLKFM
jgi:hypothetical protein